MEDEVDGECETYGERGALQEIVNERDNMEGFWFGMAVLC